MENRDPKEKPIECVIMRSTVDYLYWHNKLNGSEYGFLKNFTNEVQSILEETKSIKEYKRREEMFQIARSIIDNLYSQLPTA